MCRRVHAKRNLMLVCVSYYSKEKKSAYHNHCTCTCVRTCGHGCVRTCVSVCLYGMYEYGLVDRLAGLLVGWRGYIRNSFKKKMTIQQSEFLTYVINFRCHLVH